MGAPTAEQFAQRAFDLGLLESHQLDTIWAEFRSRDVPIEEFRNLVLRRELLTNYQVERLVRGDRTGFFYGDYRVLYLVGSGSFARVFRAAHKETSQIVAVKVLRRRYVEDQKITEQFTREGQLGTSLRHANIVPIYEVHSDRTGNFLVMEFVEGRNLRDFVKVRKRLVPVEATRLIIDVVSGLAHAFGTGVTHRDLKMSNVLISSRGTAKLVDFGLAAYSEKLTDEVLATHPNPRTIDYAGLERVTGVRKDDPRSDTYFAGGLYYNMLTGQSPLYETKDRIARLSAARFQEVIPITRLLPSLPSPVVMAVNKAMELNPNRRYQTPGDMLADLVIANRRLEEFAEAGEAIDHHDATSEAAPEEEAPESLEGQSHSVMIVESNVAMQNVLRERLKKHGYRVLVTAAPERAIRHAQDATVDVPTDCIVFSSNDLGEDALDGFNRLGEIKATKQVPAVLLLSEKHQEFQSRAKLADHRVIVTMPIRMGQFREILARLTSL